MATWQNTLDPALARRLWRPVRRPGLIPMQSARAMLARHTRMAAGGPLAGLAGRYAGTALEAQEALPPIVYARRTAWPPAANDSPSLALPEASASKSSPRPVVPATPLPPAQPSAGPPAVTPAPSRGPGTIVVQRKVARPAPHRPRPLEGRRQPRPLEGRRGSRQDRRYGRRRGRHRAARASRAPPPTLHQVINACHRGPAPRPCRPGMHAGSASPAFVQAPPARPDAATKPAPPTSGPELVVVLAAAGGDGNPPPRTVWPVTRRHAPGPASTPTRPVGRERIARNWARTLPWRRPPRWHASRGPLCRGRGTRPTYGAVSGAPPAELRTGNRSGRGRASFPAGQRRCRSHRRPGAPQVPEAAGHRERTQDGAVMAANKAKAALQWGGLAGRAAGWRS